MNQFEQGPMAATHKASANIRFVLRDGKRILQQMFYPVDWNTHEEKWRDVELFDEQTNRLIP